MTSSWKVSAFKQEWRKLLSYRVDFWINFVGTSAIQLAIAYFLWKAVFTISHVTTIKGMNFHALMFYYLLAPLTLKSTTGQMMEFISQDIYQGSLNKFLLYPLSYLNFKLINHLANTCFYLIQFFLIFGIYQLFFPLPASMHFSLINSVLLICFIFTGSILYFFLAAIFELIAFWADNVWSLMVMLRFVLSLFGGLMIPLTFFPSWAQEILRFLPFQYLIHFPMKIFTGQFTFAELLPAILYIIIWILLFYFIARFMWKKGCLQYSGIGI